MDPNTTDMARGSLMRFYPSPMDTKSRDPQINHVSHPTLLAQKISYQQTITDTINAEEVENLNQIESKVIMSCKQTHFQSIQPLNVDLPAGILTTDVSRSLRTTVNLPQALLFKEMNYYGQLKMIVKNDTVAAVSNDEEFNSAAKQLEMDAQVRKDDIPVSTKHQRNTMSNSSSWMVNVRKMKHQRGEAYISRRGRYVPEKKIRNTKNCLTSCKYKCNQRVSDADRELIFKAFYSLTTNEKKHFLLNTTERHKVKNPGGLRKQYYFRYFFLVRALRYIVCKSFYLGTLAISQKPVYNVHMSKTEFNTPKPDGRGLSPNSHLKPNSISLSLEGKLNVRKHIASLNTIDSKPVKLNSRKRQYINTFSSVKQMYEHYVNECNKDCIKPVRQSMYRRIFKEDFNLRFKKSSQLCDSCKKPIDKEHPKIKVEHS